MLTIDLFSRSLGSISPFSLAQTQTHRLLLALQPAPDVQFDGAAALRSQRLSRNRNASRAELAVLGERDTTRVRREAALRRGRIGSSGSGEDGEDGEDGGQGKVWAHKAGVNSIVVDRFEGRYLLSGGADGQIAMWDLEAAELSGYGKSEVETTLHEPLGVVPKPVKSHTYGVTHLSFYPFDSLAFLSSSYDHNLSLYSSTTLEPSASFDMSSVVYAHALSPIASHLLVACGLQHPAVRLVDLRSGAATHSLAGHSGTVFTVAWSPRDEHILASGGTDGTVRFWDVRRSAGTLGVLDMDDSIGVAGYDGLGLGARRPQRGKAHGGPVNGIVWTEDGKHIVTTGHDQRVRVWDTIVGANTLANFGPLIRNRYFSTLLPVLAPRSYVRPRQDVVFYPNETEILMYEVFDGKLLKRLRAPGIAPSVQSVQARRRNIHARITSLAWRAHNVELYSAHADGCIRAWRPRTSEDALVDEDQSLEELDGGTHVEQRKRKRQLLDDIYRDLTTQRVTFN